MSTLLQDLRYAFRTLRKKPGFTLVAVTTLALGIGANTAIFSVVKGVLLDPLPYDEPHQLTAVWGFHPQIGRETASLPDFVDWREQNQVFDGLGAYTGWSATMQGEAGTDRILGALVTGDFLDVFRATPMFGRLLLPEDDTPDAPRTVVLSNGLWRRRFGSDPAIVGQIITIRSNSYTVVGIASPDFQYPTWAELWSPLAMDPTQAGRRSDFLRVVGRLDEGVTVERAESDLRAIMARLAVEYPASNATWTAEVLPLQEDLVSEIRPALFVFLGAVGFVLLIACANVANLLLARASGRRSEIALRSAMGANRSRLVAQLLTESTLLAALGGIAGLGLAFVGLQGLLTLAPDIPRIETIRIDLGVLAFTAALTLATGFAFGVIPALHTSGHHLHDSLKEGGRSAVLGRGGQRFRSGLVVAEVALALVLLVGAGLTMRSFVRLQAVDPGFDPTSVLKFRVLLNRQDFPDTATVLGFHQQLDERLRALPGVISVGGVSGVPLTGFANYLAFEIEGQAPVDQNDVQDVEAFDASSNYFETMRIPLIEGRMFSVIDDIRSGRVAVINETMAKRYWPDGNAVGARVTYGTIWMTIVGVVGDIKNESLAEEPYPQLYRSSNQILQRGFVYIVRTTTSPTSLAAAVRREVNSLSASVPIYRMQTMGDVMSDAVAQPRFALMLMGVFAAVAALLAAVGLYGVMSYTVAEQTREIGIRMALGAKQADVLRQVVARGGILALIGVGIGLAGAFGVTRLLSSLLFDVSATDTITFVSVPVLLVTVAVLACLVPAVRAARVDPMIPLRSE